MRSRNVLALLRAQATHPGAAFPFACAAPSIACAPSASSSTGHTVLPSPPPPSSLLSGIFGQGPQGYGAPHEHLRDERIRELLGLTHIDIFGREIGGAGGGNRNGKLRDLILEKLYQHKETTAYSLPTMIAEKLILHSPETWSTPRQQLARSFSSDCKYSQSRESDEDKQTAVSLAEILQVNKEILHVNKEIFKFLQENHANKAPKTAPSSAASTATDLETVKPPGLSTHIPSNILPDGLLGSIMTVALSAIEAIIKVFQEWIPKDSLVQVWLVMLVQSINLAKDPAAKAALNNLMGKRKIWDIIFVKGMKKVKAGEDKSTETIISAECKSKKLQQLWRILEDWLCMVERHQVPLAIAMILAIVVYHLAQVTWTW